MKVTACIDTTKVAMGLEYSSHHEGIVGAQFPHHIIPTKNMTNRVKKAITDGKMKNLSLIHI